MHKIKHHNLDIAMYKMYNRIYDWLEKILMGKNIYIFFINNQAGASRSMVHFL